MGIRNDLTRLLRIDHPIIQAPMGGGATTPELVSAASNAGALGFIAAPYLSPDEIEETSRAVRAGTSRPFGINLFAPVPAPPTPPDPAPAVRRLTPYHAEVGLPAPALPERVAHGFDDQLAAALESGASVFSFTFGVLPAPAMREIKARGMLLVGTATTVEEAVVLERAGVDAVVAQGSEAGAHRGTFAADFEAAMIGTMALVPQVADAVRVPVIASGGIMDGRGIAAALALGAGAVQMGTAFLACDESGVPDAYKNAVLAAGEHETRVTRAFSGRPARGIVNRLMTDLERGGPGGILPFPFQNALTRALRGAAAKQGRADLLSLWAGQGVRLARREPAAALVERLARETASTLRRLGALSD
ncbi:MAG TPA: nitronate monooxygenase [Gemmatimonadaceae bacterium]|nr:nitronate monooxygenase [Gemmatimonadaceae bacterium]